MLQIHNVEGYVPRLLSLMSTVSNTHVKYSSMALLALSEPHNLPHDDI